MSTPRRVLFLCTGNASRSQMAEGWARTLHPERLEAYSAGVDPHPLSQRAVRVMAEAGVDIAQQQSKHVRDVPDVLFDAVVILCSKVVTHPPPFAAGTRVIESTFDDPVAASDAAPPESDDLQRFRRIRDEIRDFVTRLPDLLD